MKNFLKLMCAFTLAAQFWNAFALCPQWTFPEKRGILETQFVDEASGLSFSSHHSDRLYHINDSGDGPHFYVTNASGSQTQKVSISGFYPFDVEDLAYGDCDSSGQEKCLVIADVGDNAKIRSYVELIFIKEMKSFNSTVTPYKRIKLTYPNGRRNAEGVAMHPNGDIFIVSKEQASSTTAGQAQVYKLAATTWRSNVSSAQLTSVGVIDVPYLVGTSNDSQSLVTGFDIAPDGKRALLLTYVNALEIQLDFTQSTLKSSRSFIYGKDYTVIDLRHLPQQEAIAYTPSANGFLYSTEFHGNEAPLMSSQCLY